MPSKEGPPLPAFFKVYWPWYKAPAPPPAPVLTAVDIRAATTLTMLDSYYELANELFIRKGIPSEEYSILYDAYSTRFNELIAGG